MTDERIKELHSNEQNLQNLIMQKQQFQAQLVELDSALGELEKTDESYRIIGNIMVKADKPSLKADLKEKKHIVELRIRSLEKQEKGLKDRSKKIQEEVLKK